MDQTMKKTLLKKLKDEDMERIIEMKKKMEEGVLVKEEGVVTPPF
jgi:hypothetical protein